MKKSDFILMDDDTLIFRVQISIPDNNELKKEIIANVDISPYAMHFRSTKMYRNSRESYWWSNMKKGIAEFVAKHLVC